MNTLTKPYVIVANGVNLDLLGRREKVFYGEYTLKDVERHIHNLKDDIAKICGFAAGCDIYFFQTNDECTFLEKISQPCDGIVLNAGAWTHTSLALSDRLAALKIPFVEIHVSNLSQREFYRHSSFISSLALGVVYGFGLHTYSIGLMAILTKIKELQGIT